jgi:hypothetical protein
VRAEQFFAARTSKTHTQLSDVVKEEEQRQQQQQWRALKTKSLRVINGVGGAGVIIVAAATAQAVNNNARTAARFYCQS